MKVVNRGPRKGGDGESVLPRWEAVSSRYTGALVMVDFARGLKAAAGRSLYEPETVFAGQNCPTLLARAASSPGPALA